MMTFLESAESMKIILAGVGILLFFLLWRAHCKKDGFDLYDLIMKDGKASMPHILHCCAFISSTWVLIYVTIHSALTEWHLTTYMGIWAASKAHSDTVNVQP